MKHTNMQKNVTTNEEKCTLPPAGWQCSRGKHSEGPCAATRAALSEEHLKALLDYALDYGEAQVKDHVIEIELLVHEVRASRELLKSLEEWASQLETVSNGKGVETLIAMELRNRIKEQK